MARILKHNEQACGTGEWRIAAEDADPAEYVRRLLQSSVLTHTRSFVAWYAEEHDSTPSFDYPRGRTVRREIARGEAR